MKVIDGWLKGAIHCPSPNFNERPKDVKPDLLVVHNISLPPGEYGGGHVQQFFQNSLNSSLHPYFKEIEGLQVSAHFLIERDGGITQFVSCLDRAWHAGASHYCGRENCNDFSIGIELEGQDCEPYSNEQYSSLEALTQALFEAFPDMNSENIVGHSDIAPDRKTDPGPAFDWQRYKEGLVP